MGVHNNYSGAKGAYYYFVFNTEMAWSRVATAPFAPDMGAERRQNWEGAMSIGTFLSIGGVGAPQKIGIPESQFPTSEENGGGGKLNFLKSGGNGPGAQSGSGASVH